MSFTGSAGFDPPKIEASGALGLLPPKTGFSAGFDAAANAGTSAGLDPAPPNTGFSAGLLPPKSDLGYSAEAAGNAATLDSSAFFG